MSLLIYFQDDAALDPAIVGHKFASLTRAFRAGLSVPPAFVLSVEAHRFFRSHRQWPPEVFDQVRTAAARLGLAGGISVRSSATVEDLETRSFAGQYSTFLNIQNEAVLKEKIEKCWASAERILPFYCQVEGLEQIDPAAILVAVILQKMVRAAAAGVAFSRNPMFPSRREVVIEFTEGLGEKLVSGHVTPYRGYVRDGGQVLIESSYRLQKSRTPPLKRSQWQNIAALAQQVEKLASAKPQDIEWALDQEGALWLLQSRPITTIREVEENVPAGIWTRKIADDLWADRLTPFLADAMVRNSPRYDLTSYTQYLGIAPRRPTLTVIKGFLYVNVEALQQVLKLIPRRFRIADLRSLFPPGLEMEVPPPTLWRLARLLFQSAAMTVLVPRANPFFCRPLTMRSVNELKRRLEEIRHRPAGRSPLKTLQKVRDAVEIMACLQEVNQWPYSYATIHTWLLHWLIVDLCGMEHRDFLRLMGEGGHNVTVEIESELRRIAHSIRRSRQLRAAFSLFLQERSGAQLPPEIQGELRVFLAKYGVRSRNRTLYVKRWAEDPDQVIRMLALLTLEPLDEAKRSKTDLNAILSRVPWPLALLVRAVHRYAREFMDLREELRFFLDQILDLIRRSLLDLGGETGLGDLTMFLTEAELKVVVWGKLDVATARDRAKERFDVFKQEHDPYTYYVNGRPISDLVTRDGLIKGIGTSCGRVTGPARIVEDPSRADLRQGDILVAKSTDPGWTPVLSIVRGVVAEEGGLLNHCSIVARELGIPAVVGVREATRRIPEGSLVTIDGDLGLIQIGEHKSL